MNIDNSNYKYRLGLAKELELLKTLLFSVNVQKKSIDSIDRAVKCLKDKNFLPRIKQDESEEEVASPLSWGYSIKGFVIQIDLSGTLQYPKTITNASLEFSINLNGIYCDPSEEIRDPFNHLEFNIVIQGNSRKRKEHVLSYHLDRHIEGEKESNEVHPIYHFQIGGRKIDDYKLKQKNFGNQLIIDSPRFMHYPMDFIAGLDFVLSNFAPDIWRKLKRDPRYIRIIKSSQARTIKPFIASLAKHFEFHNPSNNTWGSKKICPQLA
ncbi:hypothetical protein [uncultured Draconibacterium sp.]|uniref:hypothetical protein n=1 Tax=uncultured Draconibacterium sp. TaxID=1573823 RepID=UPI002AA7D005|nr:hypothetical protein [uncultured Draconibacterium sp.]